MEKHIQIINKGYYEVLKMVKCHRLVVEENMFGEEEE